VQHIVHCGHPARRRIAAEAVVVVQQTLGVREPTSHFYVKNILQLSLAWGRSASAPNKGAWEAESSARPSPAPLPAPPRCPYLPPRRPRGAWAPAAGLLCCGAPSSEKQREHVRSRELPIALRYCFTTLQTQIIFRPKKACRAAAQGPSPAVSVIRGKLMRCQVLRSSRIEKGSVLHCTLNCIFLFK